MKNIYRQLADNDPVSTPVMKGIAAVCAMIAVLMVLMAALTIWNQPNPVNNDNIVYEADPDCVAEQKRLARKHGPTVFGGLLDPIADKVFVAFAYLPFADVGMVPPWAVALMFVRELLITALRSLASEQGRGDEPDELAALARALGLTLGPIEAEGGLTRVQVTCPDVQVAEALTLAIGRVSAREQVPLARLELGRRRLEQRFARVTGATVEA